MRRLRSTGGNAICLVACSVWALPSSGQLPPTDDGVRESFAIHDGVVTLKLDPTLVREAGLGFVPRGHLSATETTSGVETVTFPILPSATLVVHVRNGTAYQIGSGFIETCGALLWDRAGARIVLGNLRLAQNRDGRLYIESTLTAADDLDPTLELTEVTYEFEAATGFLRIAGDIGFVSTWAEAVGAPEWAGVSIGRLVVDADTKLEPIKTDRRYGTETRCGLTTSAEAGEAAASLGSDIIIADLQSIIRYGHVGNLTSYAIGTTACSIGTERTSWVSYSNDHPVILQNIYRLKNERFDQIGMSWVKHGFYAVSQSYCSPCSDITNGSELGVGCSDPYSASLNGIQSNMSPRSLVDPHTGHFEYPWDGFQADDVILDRRVQVHDADLDPIRNASAMYFMEGLYLNADDAAAGNHDNNASYRRVELVASSPTTFSFRIHSEWPTQRGQAAVRAWADHDPEVIETDIRVPAEGLFLMGNKVTEVEPRVWRYTYALQNLNSDRAARSFSVSLPPNAQPFNIYFHDIDHHSGEDVDTTDWSIGFADSAITWYTDTYDVSPNANALRYDTTFTFGFDCFQAPGVRPLTIGLFKPGFPSVIQWRGTAPGGAPVDCNDNGNDDRCDLRCDGTVCFEPCGISQDCNDNGIPDECEPDCDSNGVPDDCVIASCLPGDLACADCNANQVPDGCETDCDGNGIPDDCVPPGDTDGDGVDDCRDRCPTTTLGISCSCPQLDLCCWSTICIPDYPRQTCLEQGGITACQSPPCRQGCLLGDMDNDGDIDLSDIAALQRCYSGPKESGGFLTPSDQCLFPADIDEDFDIDLQDYQEFLGFCSGPY